MNPDFDTIRIQEKIAYLEQNVAELSSVMYEQQKQMDRLSRMLEYLTEKLGAIQETGTDAIPSEKPPHY
ncbi:MAG: SlyX family protein [Opitutales bacterium]|nr:SlyX family protein [Opitutales bacterium]